MMESSLKYSAPFCSTPSEERLFDAQTGIEQEIDEIMASAHLSSGDLQPEDLFSWSAPELETIHRTAALSINRWRHSRIMF